MIFVDIMNDQEVLNFYGLPLQTKVINEYAVRGEQNPGGAAWFISRFERYNTTALRGNWASGYALHDYFADLPGKPGATEACYNSSCNITTGYWSNGGYNVYKYYNLAMTGHRVQTFGSPHNLFDIYATHSGRSSVLGGSRLTAGT